MTQIQFSVSAIADLQRLRDFIAVNSEEAAARVALRIRESIATLALYPAKGRPVNDLEGVRELIAGNYVIRYLYENEERIVILRVWHGKEYRDS
ncbi:plasmid stabilization system protein [Xenococcus sp. PCC 7305]|uniref:type II toxin-antitoxin system RelE/ParE family toxin n=1 Tax=Xenococcus sp. PCC 7305 TaxID=102125 RepID=UPI0002ACC1E4|nr:type II toxin-antitoxin system RelE/ParE family toxin [Xenococcus sp. PCC 7305]ELS03640.1 plasmid stabilization system protein [Xenococcus sp. PCC 7305]